MKKILTIIAVAAVMALVATSCKEAPKETQPTAEVETMEQDPVVALCLADTSRNPIEILERLMSQPDCPMHGPTHHVLVGAALLTAYNNALNSESHQACLNGRATKGEDEVNCLPDSAKLDMEEALAEVRERGEQVPGGACGYMSACGASISTGIFMSIITRNTPFSTDTWRLCNLCTARALEQVALNGGPRCCKRDSYLSVLTAIDFVKEHLGVEMEKPEVRCSRSQINEQCIGKKCPFAPKP